MGRVSKSCTKSIFTIVDIGNLLLYLIILPCYKLKICPQALLEVSSSFDICEKCDDSGSLWEGFFYLFAEALKACRRSSKAA
jgi:hypothetical protein